MRSAIIMLPVTETRIYVCLYLVQCYDVNSMFYCVSCPEHCIMVAMSSSLYVKYLTHAVQAWPDSQDDLLMVHITTLPTYNSTVTAASLNYLLLSL